VSPRRLLVFIALAVLPVVLAVVLVGVDLTTLLGGAIWTENAMIAGEVHQVSAPATGQVSDLLVEAGDEVERGQPLLTLVLAPGASPTARLAARVRAPADGKLLQVAVVRGQIVNAGQPVAFLADPQRLWVMAFLDETSARSVRVGQRAEVYLPAFDRTLTGWVAEVLPATTPGGTPPATPGGRPAGAGPARPQPVVPVKIAVETLPEGALPGLSASVRILTR